MGRGVSSGGGQSSLGYLFGSGEAPKPAPNNAPSSSSVGPAANTGATSSEGPAANTGATTKPIAPAQPTDVTKQIPAGINSNTANNYHRADGQNCGNFITGRPSTKVHSAPGGGSSLDYLFGGGGGGGGSGGSGGGSGGGGK